jgi:hypothetical protein
MIKTCIQILLLCSILHSAVCVQQQSPGPNALWPIIYAGSGNSGLNLLSFEQIDGKIERRMYEYDLLPPAQNVYRYNSTTPEFIDAHFHAALSRTSNCRPSYDKWDCGELCETYLPDGEVIRSFSTFPMGITGSVVLSHQ